MNKERLPKSLWRFAPRIASFGPSPRGYLAELTPGFIWYGDHEVAMPTIRQMVKALGNLHRCFCDECKAAPPEVLSIGAQLAQMRRQHFGGRMPKVTQCRRCGYECASATEARKHCYWVAGRPPLPTPCRKCGVECASRVEARDHCRVPRVRREVAAVAQMMDALAGTGTIVPPAAGGAA